MHNPRQPNNTETHLDVDAVKVETGLGEVLELLAKELVVGLVVVVGVGSHCG